MSKRFIAYSVTCVAIMLFSFMAIRSDQPRWADYIAADAEMDRSELTETGFATHLLDWFGKWLHRSDPEYVSLAPEVMHDDTTRKIRNAK